MPFHTIECNGCGLTRDMRFAISESPTEKAAATACEKCGGTHAIKWAALETGKPMVTFQPGFYNVGTNGAYPKWYDTKRQMITDADRHGLRIRRG